MFYSIPGWYERGTLQLGVILASSMMKVYTFMDWERKLSRLQADERHINMHVDPDSCSRHPTQRPGCTCSNVGIYVSLHRVATGPTDTVKL